MTDVEPADAGRRLASRRVADLLRAQIDGGRYRPGEQLPSYRQIATEHDIAINTAQAAVRLLVTEGRAVVRPSSGAFVAGSGDDEAHLARVDANAQELAAVRAEVQQARRALDEADRLLSRLTVSAVSSESDDLAP